VNFGLIKAKKAKINSSVKKCNFYLSVFSGFFSHVVGQDPRPRRPRGCPGWAHGALDLRLRPREAESLPGEVVQGETRVLQVTKRNQIATLVPELTHFVSIFLYLCCQFSSFLVVFTLLPFKVVAVGQGKDATIPGGEPSCRCEYICE
jgi:hypothetical protein